MTHKEIDRLAQRMMDDLGIQRHVWHGRRVQGRSADVLMSSYNIKRAGLRPLGFGGRTVVSLTLPNGVAVTAKAECSERDHYDKSVGRNLATQRAFGVLAGSPTSMRRHIGLNDVFVEEVRT